MKELLKMKYKLNLCPEPFAKMKSGLKKIEMRLFDEKRSQIKIGDLIEFTNKDTKEKITCKVINLYRFKNFEELYANFDKSVLGYYPDEEAKPSDMNTYYPQEKIEKYGVLGIEIQRKREKTFPKTGKIEVVEVKSKKEIKDFINLPLNLYKNNPYFVPPLYSDELKMFKKDYVYYDTSESVFFNAYRGGKIVGRIQCILQHASNDKWGQKRVRFTRFDSIDDQEVANALFEKAEAYAKAKGMEEVVGPLGFSDLEREGLLIQGFDYLATFEEQYNFSYYQKLIENCGYKKDVDWIEHRLYPNERIDKVIAIADKILQKGQLKVLNFKSLKKFAKEGYVEEFFNILDTTYDKIYGTVPFTPGMKKMLLENFAPIVNMNYLPLVVDENNKIVAFALAFPEMGPIFRESNGHLYPKTIAKLLANVKHPKHIDLGLVGVLPDGAMKGAAPVIYSAILRQLKIDKIEYLETNLNLEYNHEIIDTWNHFDHIQHKRRRCYIKHI